MQTFPTEPATRSIAWVAKIAYHPHIIDHQCNRGLHDPGGPKSGRLLCTLYTPQNRHKILPIDPFFQGIRASDKWPHRVTTGSKAVSKHMLHSNIVEAKNPGVFQSRQSKVNCLNNIFGLPTHVSAANKKT